MEIRETLRNGIIEGSLQGWKSRLRICLLFRGWRCQEHHHGHLPSYMDLIHTHCHHPLIHRQVSEHLQHATHTSAQKTLQCPSL